MRLKIARMTAQQESDGKHACRPSTSRENHHFGLVNGWDFRGKNPKLNTFRDGVLEGKKMAPDATLKLEFIVAVMSTYFCVLSASMYTNNLLTNKFFNCLNSGIFLG